MDAHDPADLALGRSAIDSGVIERSHATRILAAATEQRCGFVEAARRLGVSPSVLERLVHLATPVPPVTPGPATPGPATPAGGARARPRLEPGAKLAGHVIERTLGQGGMGVVLLGKDASGAQHALKVPFFEGKSDDRKRRFIREAQALAKLNHRGVLKVHAAGEEEGTPFCVLELVDGESLDALLARRAVDVPRALAIGEEVARALAHAHEAGVVHRDVKPSNIMVRAEDGSAVLMDFGLAQDDAAERLTRTGAMLGTPRYMAPEQALGSRSVDARADVYALGATLYELLVGEPVFDAESTITLVAKIASEPAVPPSKKRPGLAPAIDTIVLRALEKAPADRYPTALAMAEDLARARRGEVVGERPLLLARRRRIALLALVLGALALLAIGLGALHLARRARDAAREEERSRAQDAVLRAAEPWRQARFGIDPGTGAAFDAACAEVDRLETGQPDHVDEALALSVARTRAIVAAERALLRGDRPAVRAALAKATDGADRKLLLALVADDPAVARAELDALAHASPDARLRTEAALALVRLETASDPHGALRRLDALAPPDDEGARAGAEALRKEALAASAEEWARTGSDKALDTLVVLERVDGAAARAAALRVARAAVGRVGQEAPRPLMTRLWKLYARDSSSFVQPSLAAPLLRLVDELFHADETPLAGQAYELAARADTATSLPRSVTEGMPSVAQNLLTKPSRKIDDFVDLEIVFARIGEHSALLDTFEQAHVILAGLEKRLELSPDEWPLQLAVAARTRDHARGLRLLESALARPEATARSRVLGHILRFGHLRSLKRYGEAIAEAKAGIDAGYSKPDVVEVGVAEIHLDTGSYADAVDWAARSTAHADDRVERSTQGFEALAAGRPPGNPYQPVGGIGAALRTKPRLIATEALLALGKIAEAREMFADARSVAGDREVALLHDVLTGFAEKLDLGGAHGAASVARELAEAAIKK